MKINPADAVIAHRLGELELTRIRQALALELSTQEIGRLQALVAAQGAEIEQLKAAVKQAMPPLENLPANPYEKGDSGAKPH